MYVPGNQTSFRGEWNSSARKGPQFKAYGRPIGQLIGIPEGFRMFPRWLTKEELRLLYKPARFPRAHGRLPEWVERRRKDDFVLSVIDHSVFEEEFVVCIREVRSGWICLSAVEQSERWVRSVRTRDGNNWAEENFDWGCQRWNTFFLPITEAVPKLRPRGREGHQTAHDVILDSEEIQAPVVSPPVSNDTGRLAHLRAVTR